MSDNQTPKIKLCSVPGCAKCAIKHRRLCHAHRMQAWRIRSPFTHHYQRLQWKAKQRGIKFTLTKNEFRDFCDRTGYLETVGKSASPEAMSVDRIDSTRGYEADNIQIMSFVDNSRKGSTAWPWDGERDAAIGRVWHEVHPVLHEEKDYDEYGDIRPF